MNTIYTGNQSLLYQHLYFSNFNLTQKKNVFQNMFRISMHLSHPQVDQYKVMSE